ncbi:MAG: hypothetical protein SFY95_02960 [Planctomycetota bacterium]|nr:hypothetical protein [Planctomycetota bacterium]
MKIAVSPYHLTTRELPAMASALLAARVVTLLPVPGAARSASDLEAASERLPNYRAFVQSWRWALPLFRAGVLVSVHDDQDLRGDIRAVAARIDREPDLAALRSLMKPELFDEPRRYLEAMAADVLKGGPDPAITVPLTAGLDRFASRTGLLVARSSAVSVAQKAEAALARERGVTVVPVLTQASAERVLAMREELDAELSELREAFGSGDAEDLAASSRAYARAFPDALARVRAMPGEDDEPRIVEGLVSIASVHLPADAVLRSSLGAMRAVFGTRGTASVAEAFCEADEDDARLPVPAEPAREVAALVFREVGARRPSPSLRAR